MKKSYTTDFVAQGIQFHTGAPTDYVVGYARYSSENQDYSSIEYQYEGIQSYCKRNNICLLKIFTDEAQTAKNDRRPAFQEMVEEAKSSPPWSKILVFDYTRYSRSIFDALHYLRIFEDNDIELISVTEPYCAVEDSAAFMSRMNAFVFSDVYSRDNAKKTRAGLKITANKGLSCGGTAPLGYDIVNQRYQINEHEAQAVRLIFDLYEKGYTYENIAKKLNERGYLSKKGLPFTKTSFTSILKQEKYTGVFIWDKASASDSYGRRNSNKHKPVREQTIIQDGCPAIISAEQFERVQEKRKNPKDYSVRKPNKHHYMLSGLKKMVCAECGAYMIGNVKTSGENQYFTYTCPNHRKKACSMKDIRTDKLDKLVAGNLVADLYTRGDIHKIFASMCYDDRYYLLKDRLQGIKSRMINVIKALESGCTDEIVSNLRELKAEEKNLSTQINKYEKDMEHIKSADLKSVVTAFGDTLINSDEPEIIDFLQENIATIIIGKDDITVTLNVA